MRLWSLHPKLLDAKGLVALWRETLLAKHVLEGKTKGYKNHPQLIRFKNSAHPVDAIHHYLSHVHAEATRRNYNFDGSKVNWDLRPCTIPLTHGQLAYEASNLLSKLKVRNPEKYLALKNLTTVDHHPIFKLKKGGIEEWEITSNN